MMQDSLLDWRPAERARDAALKEVAETSGTWMDSALAMLVDVLHGEFTGEDIKNRLLLKGLPEPHHNNAWGALTMTAVRRKYIVRTGKWTPMRAKKSHARMTPVYTKA